MSLRYPNAPAWGHKLFKSVIGHSLSFARPTSLAHESNKVRRAVWMTKATKWLVLLVLVVGVAKMRRTGDFQTWREKIVAALGW